MTLKEHLERLERPISTSVIGIGSIGKGLANQCKLTPGFKLSAIADITLQKAIDCAEFLGMPYAVCENQQEIRKAIERGELVVAEDG